MTTCKKGKIISLSITHEGCTVVKQIIKLDKKHKQIKAWNRGWVSNAEYQISIKRRATEKNRTVLYCHCICTTKLCSTPTMQV